MKEWYLLNSPTDNNFMGGFETDSFMDFKNDALSEVLESEFSDTVELYDSSLKKIGNPRVIIEGNLATSMNGSLKREVFSPIGLLKAGMYIKYDDTFWLIVGRPGNNKIYEKAIMYLCQTKLKWQKDDGTIIERWGHFTSASKYDVGIFEGKNMIVPSNNFTIIIPEDDDGMTLEDKRVFIDRNTYKPKKVFTMTRNDDVLFLYGKNNGGVLSFIADRSEFNKDTDRQDLGLCDYHSTNNNTIIDSQELFNTKIKGLNNIKVGFERTYTVEFTNKENAIIDKSFTWQVVSDFSVKQVVEGNKIKLLVNDEHLIGKTFKLQVVVDNTIKSEKEINVVMAL